MKDGLTMALQIMRGTRSSLGAMLVLGLFVGAGLATFVL
jgi:hypothetical protein